MSMSDPIADMLTRMRNGLQARKTHLEMPASRIKYAIAEVLKAEGYILDCTVAGEGVQKSLNITLKYFQGNAVIEEITRISTPGRRVYTGVDKLPSVRGGLGVALVSTSKGIMTGKSAHEQGVGGEVLCTVF